MAKGQNKQISYHLYTEIFSGWQRQEKTDKTLVTLLNKTEDSTHYRNKTFVNNI